MRKIILLSVLATILLNSNAQTLEISNHSSDLNCNEFIKKEIVEKIINHKSTNLVPYSTDGDNWSLMDVNSRKIVTNPLIKGRARTFNPNLDFYTEACDVTINKDYTLATTGIEISVVDIKETQSPTMMNKLGFQVDVNGRIEAYSKSYKNGNVSNAIKYEGKYYAVLKDGEKSFIINQNGEKIRDFVFKEIVPLRFTVNNETLFFVVDFNNTKGLITLSGKKILYGEIMNSPLCSDEYFGYSIQFNVTCGGGYYNLDKITHSGVLDLSTQKWIIKPQTKYRIYSMVYTSSEKIEDEHALKNRNKANVYFLAEQEGKHFVIDTKGRVIKPNGY